MKKLSNLGYLTKLLHTSSTELSRHLHVDVSLISKWKSGARQLTPKSGYYAEVIDFLLEENFKQGNRILQNFFDNIYPDEEKKHEEHVRQCITRFLSDTHIEIPKAYRDETDSLYTAEVSIYSDNEGRQKAVNQLLKIASEQDIAGKLITIDCEQFQWLIEDESYAAAWTNRIYELLERGYTFDIILHFSLYQENFILLILYCSKILFHKNVNFYYHKYFDDDIYWFSFFCLEHTMSVMGFSMTKGQSSSTVFTDTYSVGQHQWIVEYVMKSCLLMFTDCTAATLGNELSARLSPVLYCNCQIPEVFFIKGLLEDVLDTNAVDNIQKHTCLLMQQSFLDNWNSMHSDSLHSKLIFFYSDKEIQYYKNQTQVPCPLLSFLTGMDITLNALQYGRLLEETKEMISRRSDMLGCSLSEAEEQSVPSEYCICAQDMWLFSLNTGYAKISRQSTLLDTAGVIFEQTWRKVPTTRKQ